MRIQSLKKLSIDIRCLKPLYLLIILSVFFVQCKNKEENKINRKEVVQRHNVVITKADTLASLSLGNGNFAMTLDVTGLQSFPDFYANGVPLGTQSEWGWNSFKDTVGYKFQETLKEYEINGRKIPYPVQWSENGRNKDASNWFRQNSHRLQLGNLGFDLFKKDGSKATIDDIKNIRQELNLWTGELNSDFTIEDIPVKVITLAHPNLDAISVKVNSDLIKNNQIKVRLRFPYPTGQWIDVGNNWSNPEKHTSQIIKKESNNAILQHKLDSAIYFASLTWNYSASLASGDEPHYYLLTPDKNQNEFEFTCQFSPTDTSKNDLVFSTIQKTNEEAWSNFWNSGGAVDFSGSTNPRANELERRVVLSQYLTKIQCTGIVPPQETGLTYNSWYGKPHLEMAWWHGVHFALWGRIDLLEKQMEWYKKVAGEAKAIATRQGFEGIRWQKMTDPDGKESPSSVGSFLIWQQPHYIYFAELIYRQKNNKETLEKYKDLVFATADFMASYAYLDPQKGKYILGKGLIPAQECFNQEETFNPTYELAYWNWALTTAQEWRKRLNLPAEPKWAKVITELSPLPEKDGVYLAAESTPDCYESERYRKDHPAVLGTFGMLPASSKLDTATMNRTFNLVWKSWFWKETWGWDFPMTAMTAARLGKPDKAIDALFMDVETNTYLPNGHNYQDKRLRIYLPGNGGILTAVAMMCAGWDGSKKENPGFPDDGKWKVKWEGFKPMP